MKKILVTDGSGFIGAEIVNQLHGMGEWDITVLDAMTEQIHGKNWQQSYLYKTCEVILHLATETGTGQSMYQINQYNETDVMGTSNLLQAISLAGKGSKVKKIILSSSRSVYTARR